MNSNIGGFFKPRPLEPYITNTDEFWRERRAIEACIQAAGIYGEEASMIEYEALKRLGIAKESPCEQNQN